MNEIQLTIPGTPIAQKRPRFYRRGNYVGTYSEQETEAGKFIIQAKQSLNGYFIEQGKPIKLICVFVFPYPKSMSVKKRINAVHTKRPDLDNCLKFVKDCLNGIAWHDDSQVVWVEASKQYGYEPKTEIVLGFNFESEGK